MKRSLTYFIILICLLGSTSLAFGITGETNVCAGSNYTSMVTVNGQ